MSIFFSFFFGSKTKFNQNKFSTFFSPIKFASYHTRRITLVVSHSHATSGGIRRILVR